MKQIKFFSLRLVMMLVFVCGLTFAADAANFTVNSTADSPDTDQTDNVCAAAVGVCTLRAAIQQANANAEPDTINFDSTVFAAAQTIVLSSGLPQITQNLTITGTSPASLIMDGTENYRVFNIGSAATVSISNLTVAKGFAGEAVGAGILNSGNLTLTNAIVRNNLISLGSGGGIYNGSGVLNISDSSIYENIAEGEETTGAGISNSGGTVSITNSVVRDNETSGGDVADGGGILSNEGTVTITDSTISNNTASGNGGGIAVFDGTINIIRSTIGSSTPEGSNSAANGGGIYSQNSTVNLTNSTITGNFAGNIGGGFYGFADFGLNVLHSDSSTIAFNTAGNGGGIAVSSISGFNSSANLRNTIVSDNNAATGPDVSDNNGLDFPGAVNSLGYNIIENINGATIVVNVGDQFSVDPLLLPLADNGGATQTHALGNSSGAVSPAIDKGNSNQGTDQRKFTRPVDIPSIAPATLGNNADIGAFEVQGATTAPVSIKGRVISENGRAIAKASVILTESDGTRRFAITNPFGYFRFENIATGQTIAITVNSKKTRIAPFVITVNENIEELNLTAQSQ